jgi:type VI secretion system protein ImpG
MDKLLPHYERELTLLRQSIETFAARYPRIAARLSISGDHSADPHVQRLLQSFALLAAKIDSRLDDYYPEFAQALLATAYPQYSRPFPACTTAQFDVSAVFEKLAGPVIVRRGTELASMVERFRFRTVYDTTLVPVIISGARYARTVTAPTGVALPAGVSGLLSITFTATGPDFQLKDMPGPLRIHVSGPNEIVSAAMDAMVLSSPAAFVENAAKRWTMANRTPLTAVGYDDAERLIDEDDSQLAMRLLSEYFAYPKKFDFVEVDLAALAKTSGCERQLTLHLAVQGVHPESLAAERLVKLSAAHLKLFCTPVVNLFRQNEHLLKRNPRTDDYPVIFGNTDPAGTEVWSIDAVRCATGANKVSTLQPFTSLMHGSAAKFAGPYWILMQRQTAEETKDSALGLVGLDGQQDTQYAAIPNVTADVTCTNGELTQTMRRGDERGDLEHEKGTAGIRVLALHAPTEVRRMSCDGDGPWRLVAQLAPHSIELTYEGLTELKRVLMQFASAEQARPIDGLRYLKHRAKLLWLPGKPMPSVVRGLEVTLTVDEKAFSATSLCGLMGILERFFAGYVSELGFVQMVVVSANTGVEIRRYAPRPGTMALL